MAPDTAKICGPCSDGLGCVEHNTAPYPRHEYDPDCGCIPCEREGRRQWEALERAVTLAGLPLSTCGEFMFMTRRNGVYEYKHRDTRNYAMLRGAEAAADCVKAIAHARSMTEKWGDRPAMAWEGRQV